MAQLEERSTLLKPEVAGSFPGHRYLSNSDVYRPSSVLMFLRVLPTPPLSDDVAERPILKIMNYCLLLEHWRYVTIVLNAVVL